MNKFFLTITFLLCLNVFSATRNDPHLPINHCYHWLNQESNNYLDFKYQKAEETGGELTFFTTPGTSNGSIAGAGLYCAKSPSGSFSYGDRLIKVNLVDDVVLLDATTSVQYCGFDGVTSGNSEECAEKTWDIKFYDGGGIGSKAWYVIQNPMAIDYWSANSQDLEQDLNNSIAVNGSGFKRHAKRTIKEMQTERSRKGESVFNNPNARISLIQLINSGSDILDSIPAMNIISRLSSDRSNQVSEAKKTDLYEKYLRVAIQSPETTFNDLQKAMQRDSSLKDLYFVFINEYLQNSDEANSLVLYKTLETYPELVKKKKDRKNLQKQFLSQVFGNPILIANLSRSNEISKATLRLIDKEIDKLKASPLNIDTLTALIPLFEKIYSRKADRKREKNFWRKKLIESQVPSLAYISLQKDRIYIDEADNYKKVCPVYFDLKSGKNKKVKFHYYQNEVPFKHNFDKSLCSVIDGAIASLEKIPNSKERKLNYFIQGKFEQTTYLFAGDARKEFIEQCKAIYPSLPNKANIDEITFTVNNSTSLRAYNSSAYWTTEDEVCATFDSHIKSEIPIYENLSVSKREESLRLMSEAKRKSGFDQHDFTLEGSIEGYSFFFYGNDLESLEPQCHALYQNIPNQDKISYLRFKLNNEEAKESKGNEYFSDSSVLCGRLLTQAGIPTREVRRRQREKEKLLNKYKKMGQTASFILSGKFEKDEFYFAGEMQGDILKQCREFFPYIDNISGLDEIYYSLNDSTESRLYNSSTYWTTEDQVCEQISSVIQTLPTPEKIENKKGRDKILLKNKKHTAKFVVTGRFEENEYYFYGENQDEIIAQCREFYPYLDNKSRIDDIYYSVNGSTEKKHHLSSGFWQNIDETCSQLGVAINSEVPTIEAMRKAQVINSFIEKGKAESTSLSSPIQISGRIEQQQFFFHGKDKDEIKSQCEDYYPLIDNPSQVDEIYYSQNGSNEKRAYNSSSYWNDQRSLCHKFTELVQ